MPSALAVNQFDNQYKELYYYNSNFRTQGCGPASIANALIALLQIPPEQESNVLRELIRLLGGNEHNKIDIDRITRLTKINADFYPTLASILPPTYLLEDNIGAPGLYVGFTRTWPTPIAGTTMALAYISTGTKTMELPFCLGNAGHYVAFLVDGNNIYLLDSICRGIGQNDPPTIWDMYPFTYLDSCAALREAFTYNRVSDTIIHFQTNNLNNLPLLETLGRGIMFYYRKE